MTNCDLKLELFRLLDVVVPVHPNDILRTTSSQFLTRVLYNMEPPFTVSLVMDALQDCPRESQLAIQAIPLLQAVCVKSGETDCC